MGWVNEALEKLSLGQEVEIRPYGGSMRGQIESGDLVTLAPVNAEDLQVDDVVLVRWKRSYLLHVIREIRDDELLIGNNLGKINGWASRQDVRGKVIRVAHDSSD